MNDMPLAQLESLASWMVNPWLFLAGAAAIALPILIHLLNKRKFKVVDWAAMDFLLDADKKNRRRIRLENLILLLLRCLAVLLIGLLLARPFIPTSATAGLLNAAQFERIVLLDDSLSMQARIGNESAFEVARKRLSDLTTALAQDKGDNSLTLLTTSQPDQPQFNATHLGADSIDDINATIEKLEPTDGTANLDAALKELEEYLESQPPNVNRVVYILSDLRKRDWKETEANPESPVKVLARLSKLTQACFVIDAGEDEDSNLTITEIRPEGTLVQGVTSRFDVGITNHGTTAASDVRVKFSAGDSLPLESTIERLNPGETSSVRFNFTFSADEEADDAAKKILAPRQVKVELATGQQGADDRLQADSLAYFPARLVRGIPTLILDGDPSADFGRAESFYLRRALAPGGPVPSGVAADVATENELESIALDKYQVIFLCNVYRLGDKTAENIEKLEKWVQAGGGLVMLPGDQIDEQFFADFYYRDGAGLSPVKLEGIKGDETEKTWANLRVENTNHDVLKVFAGQNNPFLDNVKAFRWWGSSVKKEQIGKEVSIAARLSDVEDSPALVEKAFGKGRVLTMAIPADADWTNWTSDPSYLIVMQELVRYMSGDRGDQGLLRVGEPLREPLDLTVHELDASLAGPHDRKANLQAAAPAGESGGPNQETVWQLEYPETADQGFYDLKLTRRDGGGEDHVLFAANVDPTEGDLKRVDRPTMEKDLAETNVKILDAASAGSLADVGSQTEIWWYLLWALVAVLCGEQLLGWFFGWGR
jgi:aerotolerance regulator-like protein/VWA domain-containing protein/CARDB protein